MPIIDEAEIDAPRPAFGIAVLPQHPMMDIVGLGCDETRGLFVDIYNPCQCAVPYAACKVDDASRFFLSDLITMHQDLTSQMPLDTEEMKSLDFVTECINLLGESGGEPDLVAHGNPMNRRQLSYDDIPIARPA